MPQHFALLPMYPVEPGEHQARTCHLSPCRLPGLPTKHQDKKLPPHSARLWLLQEMEGTAHKTTSPQPSPRLVIQAKPVAFKLPRYQSCSGIEFARLLPWSKEYETLPLETKQSIRHFTCQEYIQPPKKEMLPAKEPATNALDRTGEAEPGIGHHHPGPASLLHSESPKIQRAAESGEGWSHPGARSGQLVGTSRSHLGCYKENSWVWSKKREMVEAGLEGWKCPSRASPAGGAHGKPPCRWAVPASCPWPFPVASPGKGAAFPASPAPSPGTPSQISARGAPLHGNGDSTQSSHAPAMPD
ncbi:uncharacterized protein LOC133212505 [Neopsephotus bourkii]|uniref:uncharacterized protein LOC133212505 n=1 Tax=Neopsephotus bourkii TaxID=309878 RepID=UPI002AA57C9A|nr:uncharacterized protein LOC133212505 [Neopsephotus bourkii]XP_061210009.1 uncharacterized protein LOC133212505 [Neopsephotus bourkii]